MCVHAACMLCTHFKNWYRRPIKNQKISTSRSGDTDNSDSSSNFDHEEPATSDIDENSDDDELVEETLSIYEIERLKRIATNKRKFEEIFRHVNEKPDDSKRKKARKEEVIYISSIKTKL